MAVKHEKHTLRRKELNAEIEKRIMAMEDENYAFPQPLEKKDWFGLFTVIIVCAAVICGLMLYCSAL